MANDLRAGLIEAGRLLGVDPLHIGTTVSYETGGTFDPWQKGPTTKWGTHRGMIQFGEPQAQKYGAFEGQSAYDQLTGPVVSYLRDAGVKPGMGLLDIYSAVNAGRVGRYGASDAAAGGAPGTVADKVNQQMDAHRAKAAAVLGGDYAPSAPPASAGGLGRAPSAPGAPAAPQDGGGYGEIADILRQLVGPQQAPQQAPAVDDGPSLLSRMTAEAQAQPAMPFDPARFYALLQRG